MLKIKHVFLPLLFIFLFTSCKKKEMEYYQNGNLKSVIEYRNGKAHGMTVYYDEHYQVPVLEIMMKKGKRNGKMSKYFFNGNIKVLAHYKDDLQQGVYQEYDLRGNPVLECHYVDGKKTGTYTAYHEEGMIKEKGAFKDDFFDGKWEYFDERGFPVGEGEFDKGTGYLIGYDQNGKLARIIHYKENMKDGEEIFFASNGDTLKIVTYSEDRIQYLREF
jgi:antitoxin component YwqK of YwqJK toxin-antitoxin module